MNTLEAIQVIEGNVINSEEHHYAAWQHLVDSGLVWTLEGSFGQKARERIDQGVSPRWPGAGAGDPLTLLTNSPLLENVRSAG